MSNVLEILDKETFEKEINADVPVLVDFWATWCGPCMRQGPILHDLANELGDKVKVIKVDVDKNMNLAVSLGIVSIPALFIYKGGTLMEKTVGLTDKDQLVKMIEKYM